MKYLAFVFVMFGLTMNSGESHATPSSWFKIHCSEHDDDQLGEFKVCLEFDFDRLVGEKTKRSRIVGEAGKKWYRRIAFYAEDTFGFEQAPFRVERNLRVDILPIHDCRVGWVVRHYCPGRAATITALGDGGDVLKYESHPMNAFVFDQYTFEFSRDGLDKDNLRMGKRGHSTVWLDEHVSSTTEEKTHAGVLAALWGWGPHSKGMTKYFNNPLE